MLLKYSSRGFSPIFSPISSVISLSSVVPVTDLYSKPCKYYQVLILYILLRSL